MLKPVTLLVSLSILYGYYLQGASGSGAITVTQDRAYLLFPDSIEFVISIESTENVEKAVLRYGTNATTCQQGNAQQTLDFTPARLIDLEWKWDLRRSGALPPGAEVWWQWEIMDAVGNRLLTDQQTIVIQDRRHDWDQLEANQGEIRVQWYAGERAFGNELVRITQNSLKRLSERLGVNPSRPVLITLYASSADVQEALLTTYEWTGGVAFQEYGAILIGATPEQIEWLRTTIPHELAHLLVGELVFNCKGIWLPTWLSEGLAENSEGDLTPEQHDQVSEALGADQLRPLHALERGFSPYPEQAGLEYMQSGYVVEYLLREYGPEKMGELLNAMQGGSKVDEALERVYSFDTDGLDSAWRVSLGFAPLPTARPTQAEEAAPTAPPTLALYTSVVRSTATPTASATPTPLPATLTPTLAPSPSPSNAVLPTPTPADESAFPFCGSPIGLALLLVAGLLFWTRRPP